MLDGKRIAVVVPAYNEELLILKAVRSVPVFVDHVVVVDDASTDATVQVVRDGVEETGFECITHHTNKGVGGAIVTGYRRSLQLGADVTVVMAGDAQMDPEDLPGLIEPIIRGAADYSKGDRLSYRGVFKAMPFVRFLGNHGLSVLTRLTSGYRGVRDSQCGYTAIGRSALARLDLDRLYSRYGFPNDILAHLYSVGARLHQVKVKPLYGEEVSGISLFTALVRVPLVLIRSYLHRRQRANRSRGALLEPARRI